MQRMFKEKDNEGEQEEGMRKTTNPRRNRRVERREYSNVSYRFPLTAFSSSIRRIVSFPLTGHQTMEF